MDFSAKWQAFWKTLDVEYWQKLLIKGITNTIEIAVLGLVIGIFIGTLIAIVKVSPKYNPIVRVLDKICSLYVALFRGTPMVVQLLLAYYVFLPLCGAKNVNDRIFTEKEVQRKQHESKKKLRQSAFDAFGVSKSFPFEKAFFNDEPSHGF